MRKTLFAMGALMLAALPARGDWQYTKWGMTFEEVKTAAGDKATFDSQGDTTAADEGCDCVLMLKAPYKAGDIEFQASFYFGPKAVYPQQLRKVRLRASRLDGAAVLRELKAKYGVPTAEGQVERWGVARYEYTWYTGQDRVVYSRDPGGGRPEVSYFQDNSARKDGL